MYTNDFKTKVFNICLMYNRGREIATALELGRDNLIRNILEDVLDNEEFYHIVNNKRVLNPEYKLRYDDVVSVYSEFMDYYIKKIDGLLQQH